MKARALIVDHMNPSRFLPFCFLWSFNSSLQLNLFKNLVDAIRDHKSPGSEANKVVEHFHKLHAWEQQEIIDFLRSL